MLYIKTYEELTFEPKSVEWQKEKTSWGYQYSFEIDERPMSVTFDQVLEERFPSMYERLSLDIILTYLRLVLIKFYQ